MLINMKKKASKPELIAIKGFAAAILIGTILLCLPFSSRSRCWTDPLTALFTATSATCVTGLVVVDTGSYFSGFGQGVVLCLIQLGGLGIMTLGTFLLVLVGRRLSMQNEFVLTDAFGREKARGVKSLILRALVFTVIIEIIGAVILSRIFSGTYGYSVWRSLYYGFFHSVSAFCNAGFSLFPDSLIGFRHDSRILAVTGGLLCTGGLGFMVLYNLISIRFWKRNPIERGSLSLHSRCVLRGTLYLVLAAWLLFAMTEWKGTLDGLNFHDKLGCSLFQALTPRTAGFNAVDMSKTAPVTNFITVILMFIGGAPGSTAGGIKVTTFIVLMITVRAMIRGREDSEMLHRSISARVVREAITIFILSLSCVAVFFAVLLMTEHVLVPGGEYLSSESLLFETVSALGTVGLSTGITARISDAGKLCIILCMFVGRLGPLTLALLVGKREAMQSVRYPEDEVIVG